MKKIFLHSIGAISTLAPIVAVVSCGNNKNTISKIKNEVKKSKKDKVQSTNLAELKKALKGGVVVASDAQLTASEIAKKITDVATLKAELGIDLTHLPTTSKYKITAIGKTDGTITVSVVMTTQGATKEELDPVTLSISHTKSTIKDKSKKDKVQSTNLTALKTKLTGGAVVNANLTASEIAAKITDAATLKAELGIDLTSLNSDSTYAISATGAVDGTITVSVVMTTPGATTPDSIVVTTTVSHKSDAVLATEANAIQTANLAALNTALKTTPTVVHANLTSAEIAKKITDATDKAKTLKDELGIDLTSLATSSTYKITATSDANGLITISVVMTTQGATKEELDPVTLSISHKAIKLKIHLDKDSLILTAIGTDGKGIVAVTPKSGSHFAVGTITNNGHFSIGDTVSVVLTAEDGFVFSDGSTTKTVTQTVTKFLKIVKQQIDAWIN